MRTTQAGGVFGFVIAFVAFAFDGALGLPPLVRLLVIAVGVLIAVLSAGMRGLGLAALMLGGIFLVSSLASFGALGVQRFIQGPHPISPSATTPPAEDGGYSLTLYDKKFAEAWWSLASKGEHRDLCARVGDGVTNAETKDWVRENRVGGLPPSRGRGVEDSRSSDARICGDHLLLRRRGAKIPRRVEFPANDQVVGSRSHAR
jgi:hypothetical protein